MHPDDKRRLRNQRLIGPRFDRAADVVGWLGAVQAQDYHGAKWAVGQRMTTVINAGLDAAFDRGEILRTHVLRPTWHFVTPEDIRWLLELTAPRVQALNASRYRQLELDPETLDRTSSLVAGMLAGGNHLTRTEIGRRLADQGFGATGQRLAYIMMHAELEALVCSGSRKGKQHTYALVDERAPAAIPLDRDEALARLATRFFRSHGPATAHDLAWWSGLTASDARRGAAMATGLDSVERDGAAWWMGRDEPDLSAAPPFVRLLPNYDEYFSRDNRRSPYPDAASANQRAAAAAERLFVHHVVIDGAWRGGWRRHLSVSNARIEIDPVEPFTEDERAALGSVANQYGNFLERPMGLTW